MFGTGPFALEDLISQLDPSLRSPLSKVDFLSLMPSCERIQQNPVHHKQSTLCQLALLYESHNDRHWTYCFSSAFLCSSSPPLDVGTLVSAAQSRMYCPSIAHCRRAAQPSVW